MKNTEKDSMFQAIHKVTEGFQKEALQTFTSDREKEFAAWQRGSNENNNSWLREFFPKKTDLVNIQTEEIINTLMLLNHRPRKRIE